MTVAELLAASKAAHTTAKHYAGRGPNADPVKYRAAMEDAWTQRDAAEQQDPTFADPAWAADVNPTHEALMTFYRTVLAR